MDYKLVFFVALMMTSTMCLPSAPSCPCPRIYQPVCAMVSNQKTTYNSICEYKCQHDFVTHNGGTMENSKLFFCKALKAPPIMHVVFVFVLLPTFLTTLANAWSEVDCLCTTQYDPVCGTDRRRYTNYCYFKCRTQYLKENYLTTIDKLSCYELSRYDRN